MIATDDDEQLTKEALATAFLVAEREELRKQARNNPEGKPKIIGPYEVAKLTGLSRKVIKKLTLQGIIPSAYRLDSGIYRYNESAVKEWFDSTSFPAESNKD